MTKAYAAAKAGGKLELVDISLPELASNEVKIKVAFCGVCHSDLSMINNDWGMSEYPIVAGHEVVGEIVEVGEGVSSDRLGQIVGLGWHADYCGSCYSCDEGDDNLCSSARPTIAGRHGGFAEYVQANERSVVELPSGIDMKSAGPLFCGGITVFNPLVQFNIQPTDKVAVIGIGGLGHMALQFCRAWGCHVTAFTSSEAKAQEAYTLGAHDVINSTLPAELAKATNTFDLIISTVNVALDWNAYLATLKPKGRLHFVGATLEPLNVGVFNLLGGQKSISSSPVGSPATIKQMLEFAVQHDIKPQIDVFPFSQINQAFAHMEKGDARYRVVLEADWK